MRIGIGSDIHRLIEGRKLMIGGVEIPSAKGEDAHSDGDVLLHAVIDALLGAAGKGDIGELFPPDDMSYAGIDSRILLRKVLSQLDARIINIDTIITLESPKLGEYKEAIRQSLAGLLSIEAGKVSVKAKTAEGLGSIGRGDAIKAEAAVLLTLR